MLIDTHCHIHESSYPLTSLKALQRARSAGVQKLICVGTSQISSREAVEFATQHEDVFASVGVHPHEAKEGWEDVVRLLDQMLPNPHGNGFAPGSIRAPAPYLARAADVSLDDQAASGRKPIDVPLQVSKIVAIGEIGLDYYYTHSPRTQQIEALEAQLQLAQTYNLPVIFHVRSAFDDFWPIFDNFSGIKGELHSFTDSKANLEAGLRRGLYVGVNGISTFTKDRAQQELFASIPLERLLLETDAPFLTPAPFRGKINEPAFVMYVAAHQAMLRGTTLEAIAAVTTKNALSLFAI